MAFYKREKSMNKYSIIEYFFKYDRLPISIEFNKTNGNQTHSNIQEDKVQYSSQQKRERETFFDALVFEVKLPGTDVKVKKSVPYVQQLKTSEVKKWLENYEEIKTLLDWKDSDAIGVLKELFKNTDMDLSKFKESYSI